jgi:plasmid stabilization system protein ParE
VTLRLTVKPQAQADIDEQTTYFDDLATSERFLAELAHVLNRLVAFPELGQATPTPSHPDLRRVVLPTFPLSVFYRPTGDEIEVLRVLQRVGRRARDLDVPNAPTIRVVEHANGVRGQPLARD